MAYSFRFYGRNPTDLKGAEFPEFSIQFAQEPSDDDKRALAREMIWTTSHGIIDLNQVVWRWSSRFATVSFGVRWQRGRAHVGAFTDFLMAARSIVPIADVVYLNAVDADGRWDQWSIDQSPPDPGPPKEMAVCSAFRRKIDPSLSEPKRSKVFDDAWREEMLAQERRAVDRWADKAGPDEISIEPIDAEVKQLRAAWAIEWPDHILAALNRPNPATEWRAYGDGGYHKKLPGDHPVEYGAHEAVALAHVIDDKERIAALVMVDEIEDGPLRREISWDPPLSSVAELSRSLASSENGEVVLAAAPEGVYRLCRDTTTMELTWAPTHEHGRCFSVSWLGDDRAVVMTEKKIVVVDARTHPAETDAQRANAGKRGAALVSRRVVAEGALVVTTGWKKPPHISFYRDGKLTKLGQLPKDVEADIGPDGQLVFHAQGRTFRLVNLEAAIAKRVPKKRKAATKKKSAKKRSNKPPPATVDAIEDESVREPHDPVPAGERVRFPDYSRLFRSNPNAGEAATVLGLSPRLDDRGAYAATSFPRLFLRRSGEQGDAEEITHCMPESYYAVDGDLSPDGRFGVVTSSFNAWRIDLQEQTLERVWTHARGDRESPLYGQVDKGKQIALVDLQRVLVLGEKGLALMKRGDDGSWALAHRVKLSKPNRLLYVRSAGFCVVQAMGTKRLFAFAVLPDKLKKILEDKTVPAYDLRVRDDQVFAIARPTGQWRITGAHELAAFELARAAKPR